MARFLVIFILPTALLSALLVVASVGPSEAYKYTIKQCTSAESTCMNWCQIHRTGDEQYQCGFNCGTYYDRCMAQAPPPASQPNPPPPKKSVTPPRAPPKAASPH